MKNNQNFKSENLFRWLFHILFWTAWLGWPWINRTHDLDKNLKFLSFMTYTNLSSIPFYIFVVGWLSPKLLKKNKFTSYFIWTFVAAIILGFVHFQLRVYHGFAPKVDGFTRFIDFKLVFPIFYIVATATAYGLLTHIIDRDKTQQEIINESLQSELSFLRSQISPHFIFNVLNNIVYLTKDKPDQARSVTIKLSELIRYMLYDSDGSQVSLAKEIEYLKNYIDLQKVRFQDGINIDFEIKGDANGYKIEPMLLVPFVENAFKHGASAVLNPKIAIKLILGEKLSFTVENNTLKDAIKPSNEGSGIGLKNVRRRLELLYPDAHQLTAQNHEGSYCVKLNLDLRS